MESKTIKIKTVDYERLQRIAKHIPQWKGKPHTTGDIISMMMDFIWDCYPDLNIDFEEVILKDPQFLLRMMWIEYIKRAWGKYIT